MPRTTLLLIVGLLAGAGLSFVSCGQKTTCRVSNCNGCCDANGQCQPGNDVTGCGVGAAMCSYCQPMTQGCFNGVCEMLLPDGGHTAGGGAGGGGGSATGGGAAAGGGAAGGGSGMCGGMACNGCCDSSNTCAGGNTLQKCGIHGAACMACPNGQACINNACAPFACPTCKDSSGTCVAGNQNTNCGNDGGTCTVCGSGQQCISGGCVTPASCTPQNCPNGCCEGTVCNMPFTDMKCGTGGANCVACTGGNTCQAGSCQASGTGGGSGSGGGAAGGGSGGGGALGTGDCNFFSCNGCCDGANACHPGNVDTQCGAANSSCSDCTTESGLFLNKCVEIFSGFWGCI